MMVSALIDERTKLLPALGYQYRGVIQILNN